MIEKKNYIYVALSPFQQDDAGQENTRADEDDDTGAGE